MYHQSKFMEMSTPHFSWACNLQVLAIRHIEKMFCHCTIIIITFFCILDTCTVSHMFWDCSPKNRKPFIIAAGQG